ncbi:MAG: hypothetical protein ABSF92_01270 [Candidatus Acidiferrales bacterium]|jgi:hypothetical protein
MQIASGSWDEIAGPVQLQLQVVADNPAHIPDLQNAVPVLQARTPVVNIAFDGKDTLSISVTM